MGTKSGLADRGLPKGLSSPLSKPKRPSGWARVGVRSVGVCSPMNREFMLFAFCRGVEVLLESYWGSCLYFGVLTGFLLGEPYRSELTLLAFVSVTEEGDAPYSSALKLGSAGIAMGEQSYSFISCVIGL